MAGDDAGVGHRHHSLRRGNLPHGLGRERAAGASASVLLLCPVVRALFMRARAAVRARFE